MTRDEFSIFANALRTYYAKENLLPNKQAMELWYQALKDLSYSLASAALGKWSQTSRWSPTIADIRETAADITDPDNGEDWSMGWGKVLKAISRYGWSRPEEALATLDETSRAAVKCLGWQNLCMSENISVDRASFRQTYETMKKRKKEQRQISPDVLAIIQAVRLPEMPKREALEGHHEN